MRKLIVTGAGGYIGSVATYLLLQNGYEIVALDNYSSGYKEPLQLLQKKFGKDKIRFYEKDLAQDLSSIFDKEKNIDAVLHYAAFCSVNESVQNPQLYFSNNTCASQNLLRTLLKYGIKRIVFSSTCAVYGEAKYLPIDENHPQKPTSPYGESKRIVENMIEWYGKLQGLQYVMLRYFNVCGASEDGLIGDSKKPSIHLMQNAVRSALGLDTLYITCPKVSTPDGTTIRDYVNVVDLNEAHLFAIEYLFKGGKNEIINLGTENGNSVMEIINTVQDITGKKFAIKKGEPRQGEYAKMIASINKAKEILNWEPKRSSADSVRSLIKWYKTKPYGWEK